MRRSFTSGFKRDGLSGGAGGVAFCPIAGLLDAGRSWSELHARARKGFYFTFFPNIIFIILLSRLVDPPGHRHDNSHMFNPLINK